MARAGLRRCWDAETAPVTDGRQDWGNGLRDDDQG